MSAKITLHLLEADDPASRFPDPATALVEPNGLLAFGGDLSPTRLLEAYRHGIFPWFNPGDPILWWSPDPRCLFVTEKLRPNRSLRRLLRRHSHWRVTADQAFEQVITACAGPRPKERGTWIVPAMRAAYIELHRQGHAHSVEVWDGAQLIGGIYGIAVGCLFCGESMFSHVSGGSKVALMSLAQLLRAWDFPWIDAQMANPHLLSLGAIEIPRKNFLRESGHLAALPGRVGDWSHAPIRLPD